MAWTDSTLTAGTTISKQVHIAEMRTKITSERSRRSLSAPSFTDSTITAGTTIAKAVHIQEIRNAITSFATMSVTDSTLTVGTTLEKAVHVSEIRTKLDALAAATGSNSGCTSGCTGLCQGCTGCSGSCSGTCEASCSASCADSSNAGSGTCFITGTKVLMADGVTWRNIETILPGERVLGLGGVNIVLHLHTILLGGRRSIWRFQDNSLTFSGEHLMWTKDSATKREWFGTHDFTQYTWERKYFQGYVGLSKSAPDIINGFTKFAHIFGWKRNIAEIDHSFGAETLLYNLRTDGSHTFIANGYVVGGEVRDDDCDYTQYHWTGVPSI